MKCASVMSAAWASVLIAAGAFAQSADRTVEFSLPAQPLARALNEFAGQANLRIIVSIDDAGDVQAQSVEGAYTPQEALDRLLANSNLTYTFVAERTVEIRHKGARVDQSTSSSGDRKENGGMILAQNTAGEGAPTQTQMPAQRDNAAEEPQLQEIIVSAQKREERLQDVPISIAVLRGEELDSTSEPSVSEILARVPGVSVEGGSVPVGGTTQVAIRGVGAPSGYVAGPSPVGYYLDTVPFGLVRSSMVPDANVYDLDRVEVLRGPQGTLYGANAQAGVVRVLTRDPNFNKFEFKTRLLTSHIEEGGYNGRADAAINIPMIEGRLAGRAVVGYQKLSGWIDKATRSDVNDLREVNFRFKLGAVLTENTSIQAAVWLSQADRGAMDLTTDGQGLRSALADVEYLGTEFDTYSVRLTHDFNGFSLSNTTSQLGFENNNAFSESPDRSRDFVRTVLSGDIFVNELNLTSDESGRWIWSAGAIYRDGEDTQYQDLSVLIYPSHIDYSSKSWAVYGELTRRFLNDELSFTLGLRYFEDRVGQVHHSNFSNNPPALQLLGSPAEDNFDATTPRAIVSWRPNKQSNFYASYSEGFRSGLHQNPAVRVALPDVPLTQPDRLHNYEIGAKGVFWNGRLRYEAAVYQMDWKDVQLPLEVILEGVGRGLLINGPSASGPGVDLALTLAPIDDLELAVSGSWNDLTVDSDVFSRNVLLFSDGDRLNGSTKSSVAASASYSFPLGSAFTGKIAAAGTRRSALTSKLLTGTTVSTNKGDSITVVNLDLSAESQHGWGVSLFVDNLTNERDVVVGSGAISGASTLIGELYQRPRTVGVQFDYSF